MKHCCTSSLKFLSFNQSTISSTANFSIACTCTSHVTKTYEQATPRNKMFQCKFCCFCSKKWLQFLRHTFQAHSNEPNFLFTCGIEGCHQTFRKYSAINSHLTRKHRHANFEESQSFVIGG